MGLAGAMLVTGRFVVDRWGVGRGGVVDGQEVSTAQSAAKSMSTAPSPSGSDPVTAHRWR